MSNKTYHFRNEKCTGGTHSKTHLTGMAAYNVNGERLPIFVIDNLKTSRCFKEVKNGHNQNVGYHLKCLKKGLK